MHVGLIGINKRGDHLRLLLDTGDKSNRTVDIVKLIIPIADDRSELRASILNRCDVLHGGIPISEISRPNHISSLIG